MQKTKTHKAFSLVELSIVILIIGIIIAGITTATRLVYQFRVSSARSLTTTSPASSIQGLLVWFETTSEKSFTDSEESDASTLTNWYDINPQGVFKYTLTQATTNNKPTYVAKGQNGLPVARFASTAALPQKMSTTSNLADLTNNPSFTVFVVASSSNTTSGTISRAIQIGDQSGDCSGLDLSYWSSNAAALRFYGGNKTFTAAQSPVFGIYEIVRDGSVGSSSVDSGTTVYFNGGSSLTVSARSSGDCVPAFVSAPLSLSPDTPVSPATWSVDFGEIIIFNRALKSDERKDIESYLSRKWGIKIT